MTLADITTEDLKASAMRALETLEGNNLYTSGPWPIDVRPMASPMKVVYYAADGKSYERSVTPEMEGDALNVVLGERREVEARTLWVPVEGDVAPAFKFTGKTTVWSGMIFRAGDYPDKGCSFSEDDLKAFVANFPAEGVPVMSEHEDSLLGRAMDRHGARLTRIWSKAGELHGEISSPSWLDEALQGMRKSVSVGIDFALKTLREISLTFSPRVADAAVFGHRAAVAFSRSSDFKPFAAEFPDDAAKIATEAAQAPVQPSPMLTQEQKIQEAKQAYAALPQFMRDGQTEAQFVEFATAPTLVAREVAPDPVLTSLRADIDGIKAKQSEQDATNFAIEDDRDALEFFRDELKAGRRTPAEEKDVIAEFKLARKVDRKELATFSRNADGSEEKTLRERYAEKPVVFNYGPSRLTSQSPAFVPNDALGIFSQDFKEETK